MTVPSRSHPPIVTSDGSIATFPSEATRAKLAESYAAWEWRVKRKRPVGHETVVTRADPLEWTPLEKPLSESTVALMSSGGVHLKTQEPFAVFKEEGDWTSRPILGNTDSRDLTVTHTHYATGHALRDINVMFPLDRLRELADAGKIGAAASLHYGFMGFVPDPAPLVEQTATAAARELQRRGVDVVVFTPG